MSIVDSPEAKNPDEEGYFDEIRSFMGKVTSSQTSGFMHSPNASHHSDQDIDVEEDIDMEHSWIKNQSFSLHETLSTF